MNASRPASHRLAAGVAQCGGAATVCICVALVVGIVCALLAEAAQGQGFRNGVQDALGPLYRENPYAPRTVPRPSPHDPTMRGMVRHWNQIAIDAAGMDHTPVAPGDPRNFGENSARPRTGPWPSFTSRYSIR